MAQYNAYTNTFDFPTWDDYLIEPTTGKKLTLQEWFQINSRNSSLARQIKMRAQSDSNDALEPWRKKYDIPDWLWEKWKKEARDKFIADTESNKTWWEKTKTKIDANIKNYINKAQDLLRKTGQNALLAPLLPFKNAMINALKRKGENVTSSTPLLQVASLFKQKIVDRKSTTNYLEHAEVEPEQIMQLVQTILPFFTQILELIKSKKATADEKLIGEDAQKDAEKIAQGAEPDATGDTAIIDNDFFKKNKFLIIGVVAVVLFLAFRKK